MTLIEESHGLPLGTIQSTDPQFSVQGKNPGLITPGQKILVLDVIRAQAAKDMISVAEEGGGHGVKAIAMSEIHYATKDLAVPADRLDELVAQIKVRRPGDDMFSQAIDAAAVELGGKIDPKTGNRAGGLWELVGRSHQVFDPINKAITESSDTGDFSKVRDAATAQFRDISQINPTIALVEERGDVLLRYGPDASLYKGAVEGAAQDFLVNGPKRAAEEVEKAYQEGGSSPVEKAAAGARKLAALTDPQKTDPLTAALVVKESSKTIDKFIEDLRPYDLDKIMSLKAGGAKPYKDEAANASSAYADISASVESAARSPEGQVTVEHIAKQLKDRDLISNTDYSLLNGTGVTLSLEIARQFYADGNSDAATAVMKGALKGVESLEAGVRGKVAALARSGMPITEPVQKWGPLLTPERVTQAGEAWGSTPPEFVKLANDDLGALDKSAGQHFRALSTLQLFLENLSENGADDRVQSFIDKLNNHNKIAETDPQFQFAFQVSKSTFSEALRYFNTENSSAGEAYTAAELQQIIDAGLQSLESGTDLGRVAAFAAFGVLPNFVSLSQIQYGVKVAPKAAGLVPENFLRDGLLSFVSGSKIIDNPVLDAAAKATIADLVTLTTNPLQNKLLGSKFEAFKVSQHLLAGRLMMPPVVGAGDLLISHLENEGILPKPPLGEDGRPQYDSIVDWIAYRAPDAANVSLTVGFSGALISAYGAGLEKLYPNGGGPTLREAARGGKLSEILRAGKFKMPGAFGFIAGIVALQFYGAEALSNPPPGMRSDLPPPESSPADYIGVTTSLGSMLVPIASTGPWGWVAAAAIWLGGQVAQGEIDDARRASQFEGPTRSYLEAAGVRPEIASILANYDDGGHDLAGRLVALAKLRNVNPAEVLEYLNRQDPENVEKFAQAAQRIKPDDKGEYPKTAENDFNVQDLPSGLPSYAYDAHKTSRHSKLPQSITGLSLYLDQVFPKGEFPTG